MALPAWLLLAALQLLSGARAWVGLARTVTGCAVGVKKFSSGNCSGSSTLIGIVQNQCVPNFDQSTTPPTLKSYQIYSANPQIATVIDFALSDTTCKGKPIATTPLTEGKCYPITATLSYSFSSGSTPATLPSVHGLFYASYKSMSDCQNQQSVIAVSQLTDTYSVPAQFWGEAIKLYHYFIM